MSKSRNSRYRDSDDDMNYEFDPYGHKSEYLDKKRSKRMQRALRTKDIDSLLKQNDDYDDEDYIHDSRDKYNNDEKS